MKIRNRLSKLKLNLTIRSRPILLTGVILAVLAGSNLYMRSQIVAGSEALHSQSRLQKINATATDTVRAFGELKYWLTDLEISWLNESEDMADLARIELDLHLETMSAFAPDAVAEIQDNVGVFADLSLEAVDAYVDENRVLGNSLVAEARMSIEAVDVILVKIASDLQAQATTAQVAATAAADRAAKIAVSILLAALVLAVFLTWTTLRSVLTPLKSMTGAITALATGDTTVDVPALGQNDEIAEMAKGVEVFKRNLMDIARLAEEQRAEQQVKEERQAAIEDLTRDFDDTAADSLSTMSAAAAEMKASAEGMASTAEETSRQSQAAAAASEQASTNVETVSAAAEEMSSSINEIARQVTQSAELAKAAVGAAEQANQSVQGLSEGSQQIGEVVELINDIASQTNLLALNATIEAARAGEAGKGFAVVASKVKSLANQTAQATEQIAAQIASIQTATNVSVSAIDSVGTKIAEIDETSTAIASAIEQQGAATGEISSNSQQTSVGTREVSSNISGVNQAATETGAAASQVVNSAGELASHAEKLRGVVDEFLKSVKAA